ncbi:ATPase family AAA domain-containing protein 1-A, partial [Diaporthe sp. PMI_573]
MSQDIGERPSKASSSRYTLPAWFLERNVKTTPDLKGVESQVPICQCETCVKYKDSYDDIDSEDEPPQSESTTDAPTPEDESHTSAEKHETSQEDAISYAKFSELRDAVASNMLWRRMRPQDSTVLLRRCSVAECTTCSMEPAFMNDVVTQVAKSLGMGLISLSYEDLEQLGSDFHTQDKRHPVKDDWKADWSDEATFTEHFFAARSKKWQDEETISYSAWRDRAKNSYTAVLDGVSAKADQASKPEDGQQADKDASPAPRGLLVHLIDCDYTNKTLDYRKNRRVLVRLGDLIQERRGKGEDVVLVVSTRNLEVGCKRYRKLGISSLSSVMLSIVNPSQKGPEDRALRRKGIINTRRLCWSLGEQMTDTASTRPEIEWLKSATGDDLARYGQDIWPIDDVHRAAGQILTRAMIKSQSVITSKQVDSALRRLSLLKSTKESEKKDERESSGDAETKSDESVEEVEQDPLENIALDDYEEKFRDCVIKKKDLNVSWDDVILDPDTKEVIQNLVPSSKIEVEASSEFLLSQLRIRGCLLYGPPGTGKTHLCRAIAASSGSRMLSIDYAATQSMWVGETEKYIRGAFSLAAKLHPCVLLIDEADALFYRRSSSNASWERGATTQFLVEMEGLGQNPDAPLVVVATNRPWDLDEAFLRRLPQKFHIGLPDRDSRAAILRTFLKADDLDPTVDIEGMASATKGFSGSDLRSLCAEAALIWKMEQGKLDALCGAVSPAFANACKAPKRLRLDVDHFAAAFEKMLPSNAKDTAEELERFTRRY